MKIILIPSAMFPLPPVKGGAVQNLVYEYVKFNEKNPYDDIKVLTIFDKKLCKKEKITGTEFIYVNIAHILLKIRNSGKKPFSTFAYKYIEYKYTRAIKNIVKKNTSYSICFENTPEYSDIINNLHNQKVIYHLYNDKLNSEINNASRYIENSDGIIVCSNYIGKKITTHKEKIKTVYNGINVDKFIRRYPESENVRKEIRKKYNIDSTTKIIISVARLVPEKGIKELIKAFNMLDYSYDVKLIIVGNKLYGENVTDNYQKEILNLSLKNKNRIIFTGYIDYSDLYKYYWASDIGVLATLYDEPFSMAALEYIASGLVPVFTDAGGFREMVGNDFPLISRTNLVDNLYQRLKEIISLNDLNIITKNFEPRIDMFSMEKYCQQKRIAMKGIIDSE